MAENWENVAIVWNINKLQDINESLKKIRHIYWWLRQSLCNKKLTSKMVFFNQMHVIKEYVINEYKDLITLKPADY